MVVVGFAVGVGRRGRMRDGWVDVDVDMDGLARRAKAAVQPGRCLLGSMCSGKRGSRRWSLRGPRGFQVPRGCRINPGARAARRDESGELW